MQFPVLIIKPNDPSLYYFEKDTLGLVSKKGESFYRKGYLYDSAGNRYEIVGYSDVRKAPLIKSLKYLQPMSLITVNANLLDSVTLDEFKQTITDHVLKYQNYWDKKDTLSDVVSNCMNKNSFQEIMSYLR
jgi:hypothetical protein